MRCPLNGWRTIDEFVYGGEVRAPPDSETCTDGEWTDHLFLRANSAGIVREWWLHEPSGFWFIAERDTISDVFVRTYAFPDAANQPRTKLRNDRADAPSAALRDLARPDTAAALSLRRAGPRGYAGDVLASALAANGVWALSRSFKLHRPRGIVSMAGREANTLVHVDGVPNVRADRLLLHDGLVARGQNVRGGIARDRLAMIRALSGFLPVGFYYQAFYKPAGAWRFWEPVIRRFAGLGAPDDGAPDAPHVDHSTRPATLPSSAAASRESPLHSPLCAAAPRVMLFESAASARRHRGLRPDVAGREHGRALRQAPCDERARLPSDRGHVTVRGHVADRDVGCIAAARPCSTHRAGHGRR